ncbi:dihydrodipicolinate synthase family protein [Streptomyces rectiverticillatus]|uniref:dihydrodipicolinate synthase family protein n=1 Tax=Streptomyces rectiverticillatus TaxID=173860 RepID=UPI0015C33008|nr:dihydrodipicolinate synthase family protein [Streptomyces rectiverticillatus]QLE74606.1 dihydrodipicolinate synthase family protein [Streptomyces rectiverticillatus]
MVLTSGSANALLFTPFDASGAFDAGSMASLIDFALDGGADGVIALGTAGEFFTLSVAEHAEVMRCVVRHTAGRVPVTVGVGAIGPASASELAQFASSAGADCAMVLPPLYFERSPAAQVQHFMAVARSTDIPMMLYDGAGGIAIPPEVIATVAERAPHVRYVKVASTDPQRIRDLADKVPAVLPFAGEDTALLGALSAGAAGSTLATSSILPGAVAALHKAYAKGGAAAASSLFFSTLAPVIMTLSTPRWEFIARSKEVLAAMGVIATAHVRPPLCRITRRAHEDLMTAMRELGVL